MFTGVLPALITPFRNGTVDAAAFRQHVEWVIAEGVHGVVPCGTTGEAGALSSEEYRRILTMAVDVARGRVPVIAGAGANITAKAVALSQLCAECGVDGLLHVTPYYNKPTQEGLRLHFTAIAEATTLPILLYNVPGRTGVNLLPATVAALAKLPNIVGLKDAAALMPQSQEHLRSVPDDFALLSGDDDSNYPLYAIGYRGAISVTANVAPKNVAACWNAHAAGDAATATRLHEELRVLNAAMFLEPNPIPVKTALALMGRCCEEWRLPLCAMSSDTRAQLVVTLKQAELTQ